MPDLSLVPLTTARPVLLGFAGDSRHANQWFTNGVYRGRVMHNAGAWYEGLTHGRVRAPRSYNVAVGGTGWDVLVSQVQSLIAMSPKPTHVAILTGTNSINNATSATGLLAAGKAAFIQAWQLLVSAGIVPITVLDCPRQWTASTLTAAVKRSLWAEFINWQRIAAGTYGSQIVDSIWCLTDPANANGECLTSLYLVESPAIHPSNTGGYLVGQRFKTLFEALGLPERYVGFSKGDVYDATNAPTGNLLVEGGIFASSGGTASGGTPPSSTNVPLGWIARNDNSNSTLTSCTSTLVSRTDGLGNLWQIDAAATGPVSLLFYNQGAYNCAIGDTIWFGIDIEMVSSTGLAALYSGIEDRNGAGSVVNQAEYGMYHGSVAVDGPLQATFAGRFITEDMTLGASWGVTRFGVGVTFGSSGGSFQMKLGAAEMRKRV